MRPALINHQPNGWAWGWKLLHQCFILFMFAAFRLLSLFSKLGQAANPHASHSLPGNFVTIQELRVAQFLLHRNDQKATLISRNKPRSASKHQER
jgi:hypothetical protein